MDAWDARKAKHEGKYIPPPLTFPSPVHIHPNPKHCPPLPFHSKQQPKNKPNRHSLIQVNTVVKNTDIRVLNKVGMGMDIRVDLKVFSRVVMVVHKVVMVILKAVMVVLKVVMEVLRVVMEGKHKILSASMCM
jgi:hypothetical protein